MKSLYRDTKWIRNTHKTPLPHNWFSCVQYLPMSLSIIIGLDAIVIISPNVIINGSYSDKNAPIETKCLQNMFNKMQKFSMDHIDYAGVLTFASMPRDHNPSNKIPSCWQCAPPFRDVVMTRYKSPINDRVLGIHWSLVGSYAKGRWCEALVFFMLAWIRIGLTHYDGCRWHGLFSVALIVLRNIHVALQYYKII